MYRNSSLWKGIPISLCNKVRHSTNIQECHWNLLTETTASGETPSWTRYSIHLQKMALFCRETCTFPCPPLFWLFHENSCSGVTGLVGAFSEAPETDGGRRVMITSWIHISLFNSGRSFTTNPLPHCCSELDKALTVADQYILRPWDYHGCSEPEREEAWPLLRVNRCGGQKPGGV